MMSDETVDLWAIDEVHFQQYGSRCRMWVPPETKDPALLHHPGRKSGGCFRAVRDYLPPSSPDLNPIERVWKLTRRNGLHNRFFQSLHQIEDAVEEQFDMWRNSNDMLRTLCAIN